MALRADNDVIADGDAQCAAVDLIAMAIKSLF